MSTKVWEVQDASSDSIEIRVQALQFRLEYTDLELDGGQIVGAAGVFYALGNGRQPCRADAQAGALNAVRYMDDLEPVPRRDGPFKHCGILVVDTPEVDQDFAFDGQITARHAVACY